MGSMRKPAGARSMLCFAPRAAAQVSIRARVERGEVLLWEHIGTWHYAVPDYRPDEHRLMKRCQVLADRVFDPDFVRAAMGEPVSSAHS
jgi:taurine dioxygenase